MDFENIYKVETLYIGQKDELNVLLKNGWKLLAITQHSDIDITGLPVSSANFVVGATKEVAKNTEELIDPPSETGLPF